MPLPAGFAAGSALALLAMGAFVEVSELRSVVLRSYDPPAEARTARAVADDVGAFMNREWIRRPLIRIDQDAWGVTAGAILDLPKRGHHVAVEEDWVVMFTPECRANGREDATLTAAAPAEHVRLLERGVAPISARDPVFVHVELRPAH